MSCYIDTVHGTFDYDNPDPATIDVRDIARATSMSCRWGGHVTRYLSVAEHAISVAHLVGLWTGSPLMEFAALHHDSHEAYLGDAPTPLKRKMGAMWREIVRPVDEAIAAKLGIDVALFHHPRVKEADHRILVWEAAIIKPNGVVDGEFADAATLPGWFKAPLTQHAAEQGFLAYHERLAETCVR